MSTKRQADLAELMATLDCLTAADEAFLEHTAELLADAPWGAECIENLRGVLTNHQEFAQYLAESFVDAAHHFGPARIRSTVLAADGEPSVTRDFQPTSQTPLAIGLAEFLRGLRWRPGLHAEVVEAAVVELGREYVGTMVSSVAGWVHVAK